MVSLRINVNTGAAILSTAVVLCTSVAQPAVAQPGTTQLPPLPIEFNPENIINPGRPGGRRRGGGSRGSCQADIPLTAIAYADSHIVQELGITRTDETVGMTTAFDYPILWFYMPEQLGDIATEFVLKDSQERVLYQGRLVGTTSSPGIVGVFLPVSLQPNDAYRWFLTVDCDNSERVTIDGWVGRGVVDADTERTLQQASDRNRAALSASYGFWQDTVSELAILRYADPDDRHIAQSWEQLVTELGLPELSDIPVLPCCELADASTEITPPQMPEGTDPAIEESPEAPEPENESEDTRSILQRARDRG